MSTDRELLELAARAFWRDVDGEWASTMKAAKASYKEALKAKARRKEG